MSKNLERHSLKGVLSLSKRLIIPVIWQYIYVLIRKLFYNQPNDLFRLWRLFSRIFLSSTSSKLLARELPERYLLRPTKKGAGDITICITHVELISV